MRKLIIVFLILISTNCISQNLAPIGAKWYYTERYAFSGNIDYLKIESIQDNFFQGKNCKLLVKTGILGCSNRPAKEIVYSQDSVVYFWDNNLNEFQILFDFKAKKDSSWFIKIKNYDNSIDTIFITVDTISQYKILSSTLKALNVTYLPKYKRYKGIDIHYSSKIVYPIGDFTYLFNIYPDRFLACDINYSDGLRCYMDSNIGYYSTGIADSSIYTYKWTNIESANHKQSQFYLFPNPTSGLIQVECRTNDINSYVLFDNYGKEIKASKYKQKVTIDISNYPDGLYFVMITGNNGLIEKRKIIKMNAR
jgi:hypothetical protein